MAGTDAFLWYNVGDWGRYCQLHESTLLNRCMESVWGSQFSESPFDCIFQQETALTKTSFSRSAICSLVDSEIFEGSSSHQSNT